MLNPAFSSRMFEDFIGIFHCQSHVLLTKMNDLCEKDSFNVLTLLELCGLDIIVEAAIGELLQAQENPELDYLKAFNQICDFGLRRFYNPLLQNDDLVKLFPSGRKAHANVKVTQALREKVIQKKKEERLQEARENVYHDSSQDLKGSKTKKTYVDILLNCKENGLPLSDQGIAEEVDTIIAAGHDTSSAAMSFTLYMLGTYQDNQQKVFEELENIFGSSDRAPTVQDLNDMKYLECCIKETLRLYPIAPMIARHLTEDFDLEDYIVPAGTTVVAFMWKTHRLADTYPDPEKFIPERFLPENCMNRHKYAYIPFSAGLRNCIGQTFAMAEMKTVLSTLLRRFHFSAVGKREDLILNPQITLKVRGGLHVKVTQRS